MRRAHRIAARCGAAWRARGWASAASDAGEQASQARGGSRLSSALLLVPCAIAGGLGVWQLQRRDWKLAQLQEREEQLSAQPLSLKALAATPGVGACRRVTGRGELRHKDAAFVGPRVRTIGGTARKGYLLVEPLVPADGSKPVLLNRGWVPAEWRESWPSSPPPPSCVQFVGVVRGSESPSSFVPDNAGKEWFWLDVPSLAVAAHLPPDTLLVEVLVPEGGPATTSGDYYPMAQESSSLRRFSVMPDDHWNYAATWLVLSAATGGMALSAIRGRAAAAVRAAAKGAQRR